MQRQQVLSTQDLSEEDTKRYFSSQKYTARITTITICIVAAICSIVFALNNPDAFFYGIGIALLLAAIGGGCYWSIQRAKQKVPTFDSYERWLHRRAQVLYDRALRNLGLDRNQISEQVFAFHSHVLPGSNAAIHYAPEHLHIQGEGDQW